MTHTRIQLLAAAMVALSMGACATGQSSSFATRVGSGDSGSFQSENFTEGDDGFGAEPDLLASSGNVLLPGAFGGPAGSPQLFAGLSPLTGALDPLTGGLGLTPGSGSALNALVGGNVALTLDGAKGPEVSVSVDANAAVTGLGGAPLGAALSPVTQAVSPVTNALSGGGALGNVLGTTAAGGAPLATVNAAGVNVAGQPLVSLGSAGSVLTGAGSAAGAAASGVQTVVASVTPAASTVVNAAGQAVGSATNPPAPGASPQPVAGLGGLNSLLPRRR